MSTSNECVMVLLGKLEPFAAHEDIILCLGHHSSSEHRLLGPSSFQYCSPSYWSPTITRWSWWRAWHRVESTPCRGSSPPAVLVVSSWARRWSCLVSNFVYIADCRLPIAVWGQDFLPLTRIGYCSIRWRGLYGGRVWTSHVLAPLHDLGLMNWRRAPKPDPQAKLIIVPTRHAVVLEWPCSSIVGFNTLPTKHRNSQAANSAFVGPAVKDKFLIYKGGRHCGWVLGGQAYDPCWLRTGLVWTGKDQRASALLLVPPCQSWLHLEDPPIITCIASALQILLLGAEADLGLILHPTVNLSAPVPGDRVRCCTLQHVLVKPRALGIWWLMNACYSADPASSARAPLLILAGYLT